MRLDITFSVGYERRRAGNVEDRWEARFTTAGLFLVGAAIVVLVILFLIPHLLSLV
jgi:hypothetical protein